MNTSNSIGINKWAAGQQLAQVWARGEGDRQTIGWERSDGERAIETNGDPVFEGEEGFEEAWELGMGIAAASASAETTGVGECVEGTWRFTSCGVKYKSIVLAAVARALVAAGLADEQFEITIYHADGRNITGDMPHAGTWIGLPV